MTNLNINTCTLNVISSLCNGKTFCRLCLQNVKENFYNVEDQVLLRSDNKTINESLSLAKIVCTVLNTEISSCSFQNTVCEECVQNAIRCYNFIKQCNKNIETIQKSVDLLVSSLDELPGDIKNKKAVYVSLDLENNKFNKYFDKKSSPTSTRSALKRIRAKTQKKLNKKETQIELPTSDNDFCDENDVHYPCKDCAKTFMGSKSLKAHYIRVHAPKDFKCPKCRRQFGSAYLLKLHKSKSHITVICSECGKIYSNMHSLKLHESGHHLKLTCPSCGCSYKNRISFERHYKLCQLGSARTHLKKYICDICNKEYSQKCSLRVHISFEHGNGKSFACNWCKKKFPAVSRLKAHTVKHTKERNFVCNMCGGRFVTKESLLYHTRIHTGEAPYSCTECDEKFISASRRMDHMRRRHLGATLECEMCNRKFKTPLCLKKHKQRHLNPKSSLFLNQIQN